MTFGKDCAHYCAFYDNYVYKLWRRLFGWINTHCFRKLLGFSIKWYHHLEKHVWFEFETKSTRKIMKDAFDYYQAPYTVNMNERLLKMSAPNNVTV